MRAYVMQGIGETGFVEKEEPEAGPDEAILRPTKGLVCTSDVHTVHGAIGDRVDPTPMTTHRFDFEHVDEAFELMESKEEGIIKPLVDFE